ncbi:phage holin, lambda family [Pseudomonas sp. RIT-PI-AD]|uniref:phage holin, lambda family n=1 Tax=Pseudomonas sp. RIT-PI-AD TaxID=3035294 RepID=UPI0021D8EC72|nr:phage holin, lambda family [Pseudomonas sp. RIT-PI-AD]
MFGTDPLVWVALWHALSISAIWQGAIMASVVAVLRVLYDGKERRWTRILLEALICGALSRSASSLIEYMSWPASVAVAMGGAIGFLGVSSIRDLLSRWAGRRADQ